MRLLALSGLLALCVACKTQAEPPPAPNPSMPAVEARRAKDACQTYVARVCACAETVPAMKQPCSLARALPDAVQVDLEVSAAGDTARRDALQTLDSVRKIAKECIEQTARLPAAGCP